MLFVPQEDLQYGVIKQFTFSSGLQRMSVVARRLNGQNFELYTKGAPEMIASLCKPDTVPADFQEKLMSYTQHGYRVIAMAWKELPSKINYVKVQRIPRFVYIFTYCSFVLILSKLQKNRYYLFW